MSGAALTLAGAVRVGSRGGPVTAARGVGCGSGGGGGGAEPLGPDGWRHGNPAFRSAKSAFVIMCNVNVI